MVDQQHDQREAQGNAGAFFGTDFTMIAAPMDAIGGIDGAPPEPDDPNQPARVAPRRSLLDRLLGRNPPPPRDL